MKKNERKKSSCGKRVQNICAENERKITTRKSAPEPPSPILLWGLGMKGRGGGGGGYGGTRSTQSNREGYITGPATRLIATEFLECCPMQLTSCAFCVALSQAANSKLSAAEIYLSIYLPIPFEAAHTYFVYS